MVLTLMLTLAALPPVAPRPDGAVAKPVAQVVMGSGEVTVTPEKAKAFEASVGTPLQANDRVKVAAGAWVVLAILANEQVVRLDDDLELKVGELALMGAPKAKRTVAEQLETLATVSERSTGERLIGWHASQAGASAPSVESSRSRSREEPKKAKASVDGKKSDDGSVSEKEEMKQQIPSSEGGGGRATGTPPPGAPSPVPAAPPPPPPPPPPPAPAAAAPIIARDVAPLMVDATLTACIDETVAGWGPRVRKTLGKTLALSSRLNAETVLIRLPLGLAPSPCVVAWFNAHRDSVPTTWTKLQVPLSSTPRTNAK